MTNKLKTHDMDKKLTPDQCEFEWRHNIGLAKVYLEDFVKGLELAVGKDMRYKIETSICESGDGKPYYCIDLLGSNVRYYPNEWKIVTSFTRLIGEHGELSGDELITLFMAHAMRRLHTMFKD